MQIRFFVLIAALLAPPMMAQPAASPDTGAAPPVPAYRSAFADYHPWRESKPVDWRAANREAGVLGGHMGQLRGQMPSKAPPNAPAVPSPSSGTAAEQRK